MKGQSREVRSWEFPPPTHCEGPSFTHALLMDEGTLIQGQRPQPPCHLCILENSLNTLEPELGDPIPVLRLRCGTRTSCPAPTRRDLLSALPEIHRKPPAKRLEPGERDMAALDSPHPSGPTKNTNHVWHPRPSSGQIPHQDPRWPRSSSKGNQNFHRARSNLGPLGPEVHLGPRLRCW